MLSVVNDHLRRRLPRLHGWLKRRAHAWRTGDSPALPVLKWIYGRAFWVHPALLTARIRDCEPHICRWMLARLPTSGVFLDLGANLGWLSLRAARHVGPEGRVVAFEPSPALLPLLRFHQRRNRLRQMVVVGNAVSDTDGDCVPFYLVDEGYSTRNSLTIGRADAPFLDADTKTLVEVTTVTIDCYCLSEGLVPHLMKIDVEGAELMALRGAAEVLRRYHPVLIVSVHPFWMPDGQSGPDLLGFAAGFGYQVVQSHVQRCGEFEVGDYLLAA